MSVTVSPKALEGAEKVITAEEMYRLGLEASMPDLDNNTDLVSAHKWFNLAAQQGNEQARVYRKELTLEMTAEEIADAQRQAREWLSGNKSMFLGV